jgi:hypothetical protein
MLSLAEAPAVQRRMQAAGAAALEWQRYDVLQEDREASVLAGRVLSCSVPAEPPQAEHCSPGGPSCSPSPSADWTAACTSLSTAQRVIL